MKALPDGVFAEGVITQWAKLSSCLMEVVNEQSIHRASVAVGMPERLVRMQAITIPSGLSEQAIEAEIIAHLRRDLPGMTNDLYLDFKILSISGRHTEIWFAAIRRDYVMRYVEAVEMADLVVAIVDVDVLAAQRVPAEVTMSDDCKIAYGLAMRERPRW